MGEILVSALRQYKHNDGSDGFVPAYHYNETNLIFEKLEQENAQLKARIARLADMRHHVTPTIINGKAEYVHISEISKHINKVLNETPQQSLVEIQADAVENVIDARYPEGYNSTDKIGVEFMMEYAEQLRNSVKDGSDGS